MTSQERQSFVLCLVSAVLLAAVVISGYVSLKRDPMVLKPGYSEADRADMTGLVKAVR